jgi:hypothetical protein
MRRDKFWRSSSSERSPTPSSALEAGGCVSAPAMWVWVIVVAAGLGGVCTAASMVPFGAGSPDEDSIPDNTLALSWGVGGNVVSGGADELVALSRPVQKASDGFEACSADGESGSITSDKLPGGSASAPLESSPEFLRCSQSMAPFGGPTSDGLRLSTSACDILRFSASASDERRLCTSPLDDLRISTSLAGDLSVSASLSCDLRLPASVSGDLRVGTSGDLLVGSPLSDDRRFCAALSASRANSSSDSLRRAASAAEAG